MNQTEDLDTVGGLFDGLMQVMACGVRILIPFGINMITIVKKSNTCTTLGKVVA